MDAPVSIHAAPRGPINQPRHRRNRKSKNVAATIVAALSAIALAVGSVYLFLTPKLAIQRIEITGVPARQAAWLRSRIPVDPIGWNLPAYLVANGGVLQRAMASAMPNFASASVGFRLPHTLRVNIVNRIPYALLAVGSGPQAQVWVLDVRGTPIFDLTGTPNRPPGLFKIELAGAQPVVLGKPLPAGAAAQVGEAYSLFKMLGAIPGMGQIASIQVDNLSNLGLNMSNNLRIKLGQPTGLTDKLTLVADLMSERPDIVAKAAYIDVSYPARPAMMPKDARPQDAASKVALQTVPSTGTL
jgi:cell division septal protein FtsQ